MKIKIYTTSPNSHIRTLHVAYTASEADEMFTSFVNSGEFSKVEMTLSLARPNIREWAV
jgi:hypothetical protein